MRAGDDRSDHSLSAVHSREPARSADGARGDGGAATLAVGKLQIARRLVQLTVVALVLTIPAAARYGNYVAARELDLKIEKWAGSAPGRALAMIDSVLRALPGGEVQRAGSLQRDRTRVLTYAQQVRGGPWSAEIAGVSLTDPLAAAESIVASRRAPWVLFAGLFIPLAVTLLLGRVFCGWICPMGSLLECTDTLRGVLRLLEIRPGNVLVSRGIKYALLGSGLVLTAWLCVPVLGYVYAPALLSRELHDLVFAVFDRAEMGRFGFWAGGMRWMTWVLIGIVLIEVTVSRRWWCRYVCPGGALYSLLGWGRPIRVRLAAERCSGCGRCVVVCPMGLNPMKNQMGAECDGCGACLSACDDTALDYGIASPFRQGFSGGFRGTETGAAVESPLRPAVAHATPRPPHDPAAVPAAGARCEGMEHRGSITASNGRGGA